MPRLPKYEQTHHGAREFKFCTESKATTYHASRTKCVYVATQPRAALRMAATAVRNGGGKVAAAFVKEGSTVVARCSYSIRPRKPTRRVERSFARCEVDPIFKRQMRRR